MCHKVFVKDLSDFKVKRALSPWYAIPEADAHGLVVKPHASTDVPSDGGAECY